MRFVLLILAAGLTAPARGLAEDGDRNDTDVAGYRSLRIEGWPVRVSKRLESEEADDTKVALQLLADQLQLVARRLPPTVVERLREVPIWLSPPYEGFRPTGEYHPNAQWLRANHRHAELHQCIEFTNTAIFEKEIKRMPVMVLHELAHAFHDQVIGFADRAVEDAYEQAKQAGLYDAVQRNNGKVERAYAMTNPREYFAELSEAYWGRNDFFPFNRAELKRHDPLGYSVIAACWSLATESSDDASQSRYLVQPPPKHLKLDGFYKKYVSAGGYPIVSSARVNDFALKEAAFLVEQMLAERPDVRRAMIASGSRLIVMAHDEYTTDVPEHSHLDPKDYWDARARGLGGSQHDPVCSCAEENVLCYPGDPYSAENILIHEFAHNMHWRGLVNVDPTFNERLKSTYAKAMADGLWKGKYASTNHSEYFAEGVQSWFNNNRPPDHDHNHVDTRAELRNYDPGLAAICEEVFGDTELRYTKPTTRLRGHMAGYDPSAAPKFVWPERLKIAQKEIHRKIKAQGDDRSSDYRN